MNNWQVMEACESCGSEDLELAYSSDPSAGYNEEEYRCARCGASCMYVEYERTAPAVRIGEAA
jgi:hypothetical protein